MNDNVATHIHACINPWFVLSILCNPQFAQVNHGLFQSMVQHFVQCNLQIVQIHALDPTYIAIVVCYSHLLQHDNHYYKNIDNAGC